MLSATLTHICGKLTRSYISFIVSVAISFGNAGFGKHIPVLSSALSNLIGKWKGHIINHVPFMPSDAGIDICRCRSTSTGIEIYIQSSPPRRKHKWMVCIPVHISIQICYSGKVISKPQTPNNIQLDQLSLRDHPKMKD